MERSSRRSSWPLAGRLGAHVLAGLSGGGVLLLAGTILAGTLPDEERAESEVPLALCDAWHKGAGATDPVDLGEVREAYRALKSKFDQGVAHAPKDLDAYMGRPHRTGLPACRGSVVREEHLKIGVPPGLAGRVLYFASLSDPEGFHFPREVQDVEGLVILLLDAGRISDLGKVADRIGKPVYLASAELAGALGVRCSGTLVRISEKGDDIELREGL